MSGQVFKGERRTIYYIGRATGLTDVKLNLWDPDFTQQVSDGILTELGSKLYYYEFTDTNIAGDWIGIVNSATQPYPQIKEFRVNTRTKSGGRGYATSETSYFNIKKNRDKLWKLLEKIKEIVEKPIKIPSKDIAPLMVRMDGQEETTKGLTDAIDSLKSEVGKEDPRINLIVERFTKLDKKTEMLTDAVCEALNEEQLQRIKNGLEEEDR